MQQSRFNDNMRFLFKFSENFIKNGTARKIKNLTIYDW